MSEDLFRHYEDELQRLHVAAAVFRERNPRLAGRLDLGGDAGGDPHVDRLLQGFALIAARIHQRLDDGFGHVAEALLDTLYPQLVRPVPARTIVQFARRDGGKDAQPVLVPRHTELVSHPLRDGGELRGLACRFRTAADTVVAPVGLTGLSLARKDGGGYAGLERDADTQLRFTLRADRDGKLDGLRLKDEPLDRLRFHIHDQPRVAFALYELIVGRNVGAWAQARRTDSGPGTSVPERVPLTVTPAGFDPEEALLSGVPSSFDGYRLLLEYFTFPQKFLFFEVAGLRRAFAGTGAELDIVIEINAGELRGGTDRLARSIGKDALRLGCVPAVNLFSINAEPIRLTQERVRYPVVVDQRRPAGFEVYGIEEVTLVGSGGRLSRQELPPLFARHRLRRPAAPGTDGTVQQERYWSAERVLGPDGASDTWLTVVDKGLSAQTPTDGVLLPRVTATNRRAASLVQRNEEQGDFRLDGGGGTLKVLRIEPVASPTRLAQGGGQWRLVSHLAANRLALTAGDGEVLRGLLSVYSPGESDPRLAAEIERQIQGIGRVSSRRTLAPVGTALRRSLVDGTDVEIELDEDAFLPGGAFLFSAVLDRLLAGFAAANSFTRLVARSPQRQEIVSAWKPRIGLRALL